MQDRSKKAGVLRLRAYDSSPSIAWLWLDRTQERAVFVALGLYPPTYRVITPLSQIAGIQVVKHERQEGQPQYSIAVRLHKGRHIKFGCHSRDQAMSIMHKAARYVGLTPQHHSAL